MCGRRIAGMRRSGGAVVALPELAGAALSSRDCRRLHSLSEGACHPWAAGTAVALAGMRRSGGAVVALAELAGTALSLGGRRSGRIAGVGGNGAVLGRRSAAAFSRRGSCVVLAQRAHCRRAQERRRGGHIGGVGGDGVVLGRQAQRAHCRSWRERRCPRVGTQQSHYRTARGDGIVLGRRSAATFSGRGSCIVLVRQAHWRGCRSCASSALRRGDLALKKRGLPASN